MGMDEWEWNGNRRLTSIPVYEVAQTYKGNFIDGSWVSGDVL